MINPKNKSNFRSQFDDAGHRYSTAGSFNLRSIHKNGKMSKAGYIHVIPRLTRDLPSEKDRRYHVVAWYNSIRNECTKQSPLCTASHEIQ